MSITHIVSSGCSFTQDGIGGVPPDYRHPFGGCSFVDSGDYIPSTPRAWASILAKKTQCQSLVNFASSSHGNILISMTLIEALTRYSEYSSENTLVIFNLTDLGRLDIPCSYSHPDRTSDAPWNNTILPFTFLSNKSKIYSTIAKNIGVEQIEIMSEHAILALLNFLEQRKFNYRFMIMQEYSKNSNMEGIIDKHRHSLVELPGGSMVNYCIMNKATISKTDMHPNLKGHEMLADIVYNTL